MAATVIFDFDGTLANSVDLLLKLYNENSGRFGYMTIKPEEFTKLRRLGYKRAMREKHVKMRMLPNMFMVLSREMRLRMNEVKPYGGIVSMLEQLKKDGYSIGVLTSNQAGLVAEFFSVHEFPEFDFIVSERTLFGKDRAIKRILRRFGLKREQVIYIGDEPRDVTASRKARISVIGVSWGLAGREGFEKDVPDELVDTPGELLATVRSMTEN